MLNKKSVFLFVSLLIGAGLFVSPAFAAKIFLSADNLTPSVGEWISITVEDQTSNYKGTVDYSLEFKGKDGIWRTVTNKNWYKASKDFEDGSYFNPSDAGTKKIQNFISFLEPSYQYQLWVEDRYGNEDSVLFVMNTGASTSSSSSSTSSSGVVVNKDANILFDLLNKDKDLLLADLNQTISDMDAIYQKEGEDLLNTAVTKAVICLGALSESSVNVDTAELEADYEQKILEDYLNLYMQVKRYSLGLSDDYEALQTEINAYYKKYTQELQTLETSYEANLLAFKSTVSEYLKNNTELVTNLANKIQKLDTISSTYNLLVIKLNDLYAQIPDFDTTLGVLKRSATSALDSELNGMIVNYQKQNPRLDGLTEKLIEGKESILVDFNEKIDIFVHNAYQNTFDYADFIEVSEEVISFESQFKNEDGYMCSSILTALFNWEAKYSVIMNDLNLLTKSVDSLSIDYSPEHIEKITSVLKSVYPEFYTTQVADEKKEFRRYTSSVLLQLKATPSSEQPSEQPAPVIVQHYTFTKAYTKGQSATEIKTLQEYLKGVGLYNGDINGVYDSATINAVYQFQLKEGILTGKETNKSAYGWFGPATRAKMNERINS